MPNTKISALTPKGAPAAADVTVIVDSVGGANKKITLQSITAPAVNANDFMIASGAAAWAAQTLAQTKTTLGIDNGTTMTPTIANLGFSGTTFIAYAGENVAIGDVCYFKSDGKLWIAKADVVTTKMPGVVVATGTIAANALGIFLQKGFLRYDSWAGWTVGGAIYTTITGTTTNTISQTAPTAAGNIVQVIGYAYAAKVLFFDFTNITPQVGKGTTVSGAGPVSVTAALNWQTFAATAAVTYNLPTGDLSAYVAATIAPLIYTFVKTAAGTLTIDPGANNFIANGAASATMADSTAGETYATITLQLVSSAASVNHWNIIGAHGTWTPSA